MEVWWPSGDLRARLTLLAIHLKTCLYMCLARASRESSACCLESGFR